MSEFEREHDGKYVDASVKPRIVAISTLGIYLTKHLEPKVPLVQHCKLTWYYVQPKDHSTISHIAVLSPVPMLPVVLQRVDVWFEALLHACWCVSMIFFLNIC